MTCYSFLLGVMLLGVLLASPAESIDHDPIVPNVAPASPAPATGNGGESSGVWLLAGYLLAQAVNGVRSLVRVVTHRNRRFEL